jgi:hypothetical protein
MGEEIRKGRWKERYYVCYRVRERPCFGGTLSILVMGKE